MSESKQEEKVRSGKKKEQPTAALIESCRR